MPELKRPVRVVTLRFILRRLLLGTEESGTGQPWVLLAGDDVCRDRVLWAMLCSQICVSYWHLFVWSAGGGSSEDPSDPLALVFS